MAFLLEEQVEFFRTNGYLIIYQLISPGMIRELRGIWKNLVDGRHQGIHKRNRSFRIAESLENQAYVYYHFALLEDAFMYSFLQAQRMASLGGHATPD